MQTEEPAILEVAGGKSRVSPWLVPSLFAALTFPTLATWLYFVQYAESEAVKIVYAAVKVAQFCFPVVYVALLERGQARLAPHSASSAHPLRLRASLAIGAIVGLSVVAGMAALYFGFFRESPYFAALPEEIHKKLSAANIDSRTGYLFLAFFYVLFHSLLEEYYWRWFVFGRLRYLVAFWPAAVISSLGFMAHHVLVLGKYFGMTSGLTLLLSLAVAVGGMIWAWLYERSGTLWGAWLSHALVDAGIMAVGYELLWRG